MAENKKTIIILLPIFEKGNGIAETDKSEFERFAHEYGDTYEIIFTDNEKMTDAEYKKASAIIGNPIPKKLHLCQRLEWLQLDFAGTDRYREILVEMKDTKLTNGSGAFGGAIAEHMLMVLLALYKHLPAYFENQKNHLWQDAGKEKSLIGKNLLIIGTGDIGSSFAKIMRPFAKKIMGINRRGGVVGFFDETAAADRLEEYISDADIIACCLPKNPSTNQLLSEKIIGAMKQDAVVINVGRGNCIDTKALMEALNQDRLFGAALDVFETEPLSQEDELWNTKNLIITPHISGKTYGHLDSTVHLVLDICLKNLYRYVEGKNLINVVDKETGYRIKE